MKYYHRNRLLKLASILDTVPRKKFNLEYWISNQSDEQPTTGTVNECGTAGCAIGWAMSDRGFRKAGLKPTIDDIGFFVRKHFITIPYYKGAKNFEAVALFFGIEENQAEHLFLDWYYPEQGNKTTPKQVAKKIRKFVKNYQPVQA